MTNSRHVEDLFSDLFDGTLDADLRAEAEAHLAMCAECRAGFEAFERSTNALQGLRLAPTTVAHVKDVQEAVASTRAPRRRFWTVLSHAAALLIGLSLTWVRGCSPEDATTVATNEPQVERVVVEVPVEVPVEVIREVPVEVVREVVREVPVERIEYVDRTVPGPPEFDAELVHGLLATIGDAMTGLASVAEAAADERAAASALAEADDPEIPVREPEPEVVAQRSSAPLRISRAGERVRIHTRGALDEVVPALIDTLNDPDEEIVLAVEHHLEALRAELAGDASLPPLEGKRNDPLDRPGGLRGILAAEDDGAEKDAHTRWTEWWLTYSDTADASASL